jgi:glycosyltransferase involved in cell wall biosynthesis
MIDNLVSTIIPVYNRPAMLKDAVESVIGQTYRPVEVIIVDDGSTDETPAAGQELRRRFPDQVFVLRQDNAGVGTARETGRLATRGEFIQYLDSDDVLYPEKFARQVAALRENPECDVAYCYTRYRRADGTYFEGPWKGTGRTLETMFPAFLHSRWWDTPNPLYRRSVCDAAGPWTSLRLEEDWEHDCRVAALGTRLVHCREFLVEVRDHDHGKLARGPAYDPSRLCFRARAHILMYQHAVRAGIPSEDPNMRHFARELFLLSRQCGAAGLASESAALFTLAREASETGRRDGWDFRCYRALVACLGWQLTGRLACWTDDCLRRE